MTALNGLRKEVDEKVNIALSFVEGYAEGFDFEGLEYFAADVIEQNYRGKYAGALACACQCFLYSRFFHMNEDKLNSGAVLGGDYFAGLIAGFDLPGDKPEILEMFSDFTIREIKKISSDKKLVFNMEEYNKLFTEVAGVMDE